MINTEIIDQDYLRPTNYDQDILESLVTVNHFEPDVRAEGLYLTPLHTISRATPLPFL